MMLITTSSAAVETSNEMKYAIRSESELFSNLCDVRALKSLEAGSAQRERGEVANSTKLTTGRGCGKLSYQAFGYTSDPPHPPRVVRR